MSTSSVERPWITCHVLDTVSGKPARGIAITLAQTGLPHIWSARTNDDGRVTAWDTPDNMPLNTLVAKLRNYAVAEREEELYQTWKLTFDTESYFGKGNTFWPEVELKISTKMSEEHYHVPL